MAAVAASMVAALDQAAAHFIPAAFEPAALQFQAARFTGAWPSTAAASDSITGITFICGSSMERPTPITTTIPITTRTAAAPWSGLITVHAASVISATGVTIIGVTIAGTGTTTIAFTGEHPSVIAEMNRAPQGARFAFCSDREPLPPVLEFPGPDFPRRKRFDAPLPPPVRRPVTETRRLLDLGLHDSPHDAPPGLARRLADHVDEFRLLCHCLAPRETAR